jgi:hypothetical protein
VKDGFNIRFDLYQGSIKYSAAYAPGINVRKGYYHVHGDWCPNNVRPVEPYYTDDDVTALPRDTAFTDFMGNGQWDCQRYWTMNHTANLPTVLPNGQTGVCGSAAATTWSRYNVYRYEIAQGLINDWSGNRAPNGTGESGAPLCAGAGSGVDETTGKTDRRLIIVPIINCLANGPFPPGFNATDIPVAAFGNFFMTQPVDGSVESDPGNPLYGELTGQTTAANADIYVPVQLYR